MQPSPPLTRNAIASTLSTRDVGQRLELFDHVPSTNREATELAQAGCEHGTVVAADSQTAGRGRLSRTWFSPAGSNVYCSIVVKKPIPADRLTDWLSWLPLVAALAVAEAVQTVAATTLSVKWPNDLVVADRKIGGILCESGTAQAGPYQVIGIGLNVNVDRGDFPIEIRNLATSIWQERGMAIDRNRLLAQLLNELEPCIDELAERGTERVARAYRQRCSTIGKTVKATLAAGSDCVGLAEAIGPDGSLQVRTTGVPTSLLSLRVADIIHLRS